MKNLHHIFQQHIRPNCNIIFLNTQGNISNDFSFIKFNDLGYLKGNFLRSYKCNKSKKKQITITFSFSNLHIYNMEHHIYYYSSQKICFILFRIILTNISNTTKRTIMYKSGNNTFGNIKRFQVKKNNLKQIIIISTKMIKRFFLNDTKQPVDFKLRWLISSGCSIPWKSIG
jgi:hypothetical protein